MIRYEEQLIITGCEHTPGTKIYNRWVFNINIWRKISHFYFHRWTVWLGEKWTFSPGWHHESRSLAELGLGPRRGSLQVLLSIPSWLHSLQIQWSAWNSGHRTGPQWLTTYSSPSVVSKLLDRKQKIALAYRYFPWRNGIDLCLGKKINQAPTFKR